MIPHLINDRIYIDPAIEEFETVYPNGNKFPLGVNSRSEKIRFIKNTKKIGVSSILCGGRDFFCINNGIESED